ncbi:MAG: ParB/RepB/Spo0J family partition protein, partial [Thermoguttaceae bacterium]
MTKERRLGRGLEALLGKVATQQAEENAAVLDQSSSRPWLAVESAYGLGDQPYTSSLSPDSERAGLRMDGAHALAIALPEEAPPENEPPLPNRLDIRLIDSNPFQPRTDFDDDELDALTDSLRVHGLLQPLVVRAMGNRYQLVAGERRLRAAARAGWTEVPIVVVDADDRETAELAIIENLQRKDLNPLEKASSFQRYLDQY